MLRKRGVTSFSLCKTHKQKQPITLTAAPAHIAVQTAAGAVRTAAAERTAAGAERGPGREDTAAAVRTAADIAAEDIEDIVAAGQKEEELQQQTHEKHMRNKTTKDHSPP